MKKVLLPALRVPPRARPCRCDSHRPGLLCALRLNPATEFGAISSLKLSMPVLYVWLCLFYCLFNLWLNIVAELLRFGDREFYKDWWNAKTVEEPVHKWMVRHIYFPSIRLGLSKGVAVFLVFVISALFHEVAIGAPCHMLRCWTFLGIMFQCLNMRKLQQLRRSGNPYHLVIDAMFSSQNSLHCCW